jgi:site-specific DNA-methyltransferase (adenine-specific)
MAEGKWRVQHSSQRDDWGTPQELFDELNHEFGFSLDACARLSNTKCRMFIAPHQDALTQEDGAWFSIASTGIDKSANFWVCPTIWMNPPYGHGMNQWLLRAWREAQHGCVVVCLVFACTDTIWWDECVWNLAHEVRFIKGRVRFIDPETNKASAAAPKGSAVVIYRPGRRLSNMPTIQRMNNPKQETK